jgi:hypothetical protein
VQPVPEKNFGPFGPIFAMDQPASGARTRDALGWQPTHPSLLEDLENIQPRHIPTCPSGRGKQQ